MVADHDDTDVRSLGRAELERLAFGPGTDAATAARARAALGLEGRPASVGSAPDHGSAAPVPASARARATPDVPAQASAAPGSVSRVATDAHGPAPTLQSGPPGRTTDTDDPAPTLRSDATGRATDADAPRSVPAPTGLRRPRSRRRWRPVALVVGTAIVAAGLGVAGTVLAGRVGPAVAQDGSSDSGSEMLTRVLARGQTAEDEIPRTIDAAVDRPSARLLFANYADRPPVPWVVWIVDARSGDDVCIVASPDRYASDVTCLPRAEVLHGHVSYTTRDGAQGLSIRVDGGIARIDLIGGE